MERTRLLSCVWPVCVRPLGFFFPLHIYRSNGDLRTPGRVIGCNVLPVVKKDAILLHAGFQECISIAFFRSPTKTFTVKPSMAERVNSALCTVALSVCSKLSDFFPFQIPWGTLLSTANKCANVTPEDPFCTELNFQTMHSTNNACSQVLQFTTLSWVYEKFITVFIHCSTAILNQHSVITLHNEAQEFALQPLAVIREARRWKVNWQNVTMTLTSINA